MGAFHSTLRFKKVHILEICYIFYQFFTRAITWIHRTDFFDVGLCRSVLWATILLILVDLLGWPTGAVPLRGQNQHCCQHLECVWLPPCFLLWFQHTATLWPLQIVIAGLVNLSRQCSQKWASQYFLDFTWLIRKLLVQGWSFFSFQS